MGLAERDHRTDDDNWRVGSSSSSSSKLDSLWAMRSVASLTSKLERSQPTHTRNAQGRYFIVWPGLAATLSHSLANDPQPAPAATTPGRKKTRLLINSSLAYSSISSSLSSPSLCTPINPCPLSLASLSSRPAFLSLWPNAFRAPALDARSQTWSLALDPAAARVRGVSGEKLREKTLPCGGGRKGREDGGGEGGGQRSLRVATEVDFVLACLDKARRNDQEGWLNIPLRDLYSSPATPPSCPSCPRSR